MYKFSICSFNFSLMASFVLLWANTFNFYSNRLSFWNYVWIMIFTVDTSFLMMVLKLNWLMIIVLNFLRFVFNLFWDLLSVLQVVNLFLHFISFFDCFSNFLLSIRENILFSLLWMNFSIFNLFVLSNNFSAFDSVFIFINLVNPFCFSMLMCRLMEFMIHKSIQTSNPFFGKHGSE